MAVDLAFEKNEFQIQDMEAKYPEVHKRTLQRDLRTLIEKGVLTAEGSTNRLVYRAIGKL